MAHSTMPPAIQNVVKRSSPTNTIITPVTASRTYAGLANQSSSRLMPCSTNDCVGTGSRATRASQTPYVALNPTAMIASNTWRNFTGQRATPATESRSGAVHGFRIAVRVLSRGRGCALAYRSAPHHSEPPASDAAGRRLAHTPLPRATRTAPSGSRSSDNRYCGTRDAARFLGREEHDDGGDLGRGGPARRIGLRHRGSVLGVVDDPREDAVRSDAFALGFLGQRLGPADEPRVGHRIAGRTLLALQRRGRGDVDDAPVATRPHRPQAPRRRR